MSRKPSSDKARSALGFNHQHLFAPKSIDPNAGNVQLAIGRRILAQRKQRGDGRRIGHDQTFSGYRR